MKKDKEQGDLLPDDSTKEAMEGVCPNNDNQSLSETEQEETQTALSKIGIKFGLGPEEIESARSDTWGKIDRKVSGRSKVRKLSRQIMRIAASVLIIMGAGLGTFFVLKDSPVNVVMANEGIDAMEIVLDDNTHVWLHSGAEISFPEKFSKKQRPVTLSGEAFFDVASDPQRRFIVRTEAIDVEVLGTKFNVRAHKGENTTEIALESGSISLKQPGVAQPTLVKPGELVVLDHLTSTIDISHSDPYFHSAWKETEFVFRSEPISRIMQILGKAFQTEIVFENTTIANTLYSGRFRKSKGLEDALSIIQINNNFTYYYDGEGRLIVK